MFNAKQKNTWEKRGKWVYMAYCQVEEKYGSAIAKQIRKDKKELEKNRTPDEESWYMEHPEIKDNEAICYDSAYFLFLFMYRKYSQPNPLIL